MPAPEDFLEVQPVAALGPVRGGEAQEAAGGGILPPSPIAIQLSSPRAAPRGGATLRTSSPWSPNSLDSSLPAEVAPFHAPRELGEGMAAGKWPKLGVWGGQLPLRRSSCEPVCKVMWTVAPAQ